MTNPEVKNRLYLSSWTTLLLVVSLILITIIVYQYRSDRFELQKVSDHVSYKIDKRTGDVWILSSGRETPILSSSHEEHKIATSLDQQAIDKVRRSFLLSEIRSVKPIKNNETLIQDDLKSLKGVLKIEGWKQVRVSDGHYVTSFIYVIDGRTRSYNFEIFPSNDVIRYIDNNLVLLNKYGGLITDETNTRDLYDLVLGKASDIPEFSRFDSVLVSKIESRRLFFDFLIESNIIYSDDFELFNYQYFRNNSWSKTSN